MFSGSNLVIVQILVCRDKTSSDRTLGSEKPRWTFFSHFFDILLNRNPVNLQMENNICCFQSMQCENLTTLLDLCAEKCFYRSTFMLNCESPENLPHLMSVTCEPVSDTSVLQTVPPPWHSPLPNWRKGKQANMREINYAKTWGCVSVIYWDESVFGVETHVDALHTMPTPHSPHIHTRTRTQTHQAAMTSVVKVKEVKVPEDLMWQTQFVPMTCTNKHIKPADCLTLAELFVCVISHSGVYFKMLT